MSGLALLRGEILLHQRSGRSRLVLLLYPLLTLLPWLIIGNLLDQNLVFGPATPLSLVLTIQPLTAFLLAAGLAGRGADRASREELLPLLTSSPCSNGILVLGRAAVLAIAFLLATALPFLILGLALLAQGTPADPLALLGSWLLHAWPMATFMGWTWLALAILAGSDLGALLLLFFGGLLISLLAGIFTSWDTSFSWPFFELPAYYQNIAALLLRDGQSSEITHWISLSFLASEGPYDPYLAAERAVADFSPAGGLALLLLSFATLRLGRCRADLKPRSFAWAPSIGRLRQALTSDARLGWERWAAWLALIPAFFSLWIVERRSDFFFAWGESRAAAEMTIDDPPTASALALQRLRIEADLGRSATLTDGHLESRFEEDFVLHGQQAVSHLAFELNYFLELEDLTATSSGKSLNVSLRRRYNRLFAELDPPLEPGAALHLEGRLAGRPAWPHAWLKPLYGTSSFGETWAQILRDPAGRRSMHLAAAQMRPGVSRNQVRLASQDLLPIPRYQRWQTLEGGQTEVFSDSRAESDPTAAEARLDLVPIELEILAPQGWQLFSSCAQQAETEGQRKILRGTCASRPAELKLRGGLLEVATRGEVQLATLAAHSASSLPLLETLAEIHRQSEKAWPGAPRLGKVVLIEEVPYFGEKARVGYLENLAAIHAFGSLLEISETRLASPSDLDPFELVGPVLIDRLLRDRPMVAEESWAISAFLRAVVTRRLGLRSSDALLSGPPWEKAQLAHPLVDFEGYFQRQGARRLAALTADLEGRVGSTVLLAGIEEFLAQRQPPGRLADLVAAIDRHSEESLELFVQDFLEGGALPDLQLAEVRSSPQSTGGFRVAGVLRNSGKGEVLCPLVLRTERGELWQKVRVGGMTDSPFVFETPQKPVLIELDPAQTCLRFVSGTSSVATRVTL